MTPVAGEIWLADQGAETRRHVFVVSDARFHRLAERAVIVPVLGTPPASPGPWHIPLDGDQVVAVNLLGTVPTDRLLTRIDHADFTILSAVRRAVVAITG